MAKKATVFSIFFLFFSLSLWAGGWNNTLMGCRAIAIGGAFTAVADDPSAIYYNPAGLVYQRESLNISFNGFYIWPDHEYTMPTGATLHSKYSNAMPQLFLSYKTSERITIGLGVYVPYAGGGVDWQASGQFQTPLKSVMAIMALAPTIAFHISDSLSVGFSLINYRGMLDVNTVMDPVGEIKTKENGSAFSVGFGLLFRPTERFALGVGIRGPATMKLEGLTSFFVDTIKMNLDSNTSFRLPWDFEVGISYRLTENFILATTAQYTMWSVLDRVEKNILNVPQIGDIQEFEDLFFKNILVWRAGAEYVLPFGIALRAGVGYDSSATPEETLAITNIDVNKFTVLGGIGYTVGKMRLDAVYVYAFGREREKVSTLERFNLNVFILGLGVTFSF
ncbi:MAG: OmpP1/FadL family transporter [Candidatus Aminicenantales bacterium]